MKRTWQNERGMALAVAIFALVVIGALVAGALFAGTQEQRVSQNTLRVQKSFGVAETGVAEQFAPWNMAINSRPNFPNDSGVGIAVTRAAGGSGSYGGWIYKLSNSLYLIDVIGSDSASRAGQTGGGGSGARQRVGIIARLAPMDFGIKASLTTQGGVNLQGNAQVNGFDQNPAAWTTCGVPGPAMAGVRDKGGTVTTGGSGVVTGIPPVMNDPTLNDSNFTKFGHNSSYNDLAARANITLPGGTYQTEPVFNGAVCNRAVLTNWGDGDDPSSDCGDYFPIIHLTGTTTLNGVQGQGILLVDGDLNVQGSYQFYGIVVIQGDLKTAGGGSTEAHFWGSVMAKNADLSVQNLTGRATLNYSNCAILAVLQNTSVADLMRSRGWVQLY